MDSPPPILLVEDEVDDAEMTQLAFAKAKLANPVVIARDGAEALDYLFGTGTHAGRNVLIQPVVVLLDLKLPKIDGLDVLRRIRGHGLTRNLPVVILTSSDHPHDVEAASRLHVSSYVNKPVDFDGFVLAAKQIGLSWTALEAPLGVVTTSPAVG
jgi:two-component system, response regulator